MTSRSFVSPWFSDCHALAEGGTNVRRGGLLFKWPFHYCNSTRLLDPVQFSHWSSTSRRQSIALWVNTFRVSGNEEKNTRDLQRASEQPRRSARRTFASMFARKHAAALGISDRTVRRIFHEELRFYPYKMATAY